MVEPDQVHLRGWAQMVERLIGSYWDPDIKIEFKDFGTWVEEHANWSSSKKNKYID